MDRLENWTERNFIKLKWEMLSLDPEENTSMYQHTLYVDWLKSRFTESILGFMLDSRLTTSQ